VILDQNDKPTLDDVVHYGVRGMKWGTRRAYASRQQRGVDILNKVASGTANKRQKVAVAVSSSSHDLIRGKSLKGAASRKAAREQEHLDRVLNGKLKARDVLTMVGRVSFHDIASGGRDKFRKP